MPRRDHPNLVNLAVYVTAGVITSSIYEFIIRPYIARRRNNAY